MGMLHYVLLIDKHWFTYLVPVAHNMIMHEMCYVCQIAVVSHATYKPDPYFSASVQQKRTVQDFKFGSQVHSKAMTRKHAGNAQHAGSGDGALGGPDGRAEGGQQRQPVRPACAKPRLRCTPHDSAASSSRPVASSCAAPHHPCHSPSPASPHPNFMPLLNHLLCTYSIAST